MDIFFLNRMQAIILNLFYKSILRSMVYFEGHARIEKVRGQIIERLYTFLGITEQLNEEQCDVKVVFCPIVSRAGTDIEAVLSRVSADKPTIVFVLHHTFDPDYSAPDSSRYERNNLVMVDMLFHEDSGLLNCSRNNTAISKAGTYLKKHAKLQRVIRAQPVWLAVSDKRVLLAASACVGFYVLCRTKKRPCFFPRQIKFLSQF